MKYRGGLRVVTFCEFIFGCSMAWVLYTACIYPLLVIGLARRAVRPVCRRPFEPMVSFIVAAFNEEASIEQKIRNTLALDYPRHKLEIVVASDGSTDQTDSIVERYAATGVKLVRTSGRIGKAGTMNVVAPAAAGEILVFSDATTDYEPSALRLLVENFADPQVGGVSGCVIYRRNGSVLFAGRNIYQRFVVSQRLRECEFGHQTHLVGAIHAIRRECFRQCPPELSPEHWHVFNVVRAGLRSVYDVRAIGYEEARANLGAEFRARVRDTQQSLAFAWYLRGHLGGLDRSYVFQMISANLLRWLLPIPVAGIVLSALLLGTKLTMLAAIPAGTMIPLIIGAVGLSCPRLAVRFPGMPFASYLAIFLLGEAVGIMRLVGGQKRIAWDTERSVVSPASYSTIKMVTMSSASVSPATRSPCDWGSNEARLDSGAGKSQAIRKVR